MAEETEISVSPTATAIADDGGNASRKMWMTVGAWIIIVALGLLSCVAAFAALGPNLGLLVGGVLGGLGLYITGNVTTKFAAASAARAPK